MKKTTHLADALSVQSLTVKIDDLAEQIKKLENSKFAVPREISSPGLALVSNELAIIRANDKLEKIAQKTRAISAKLERIRSLHHEYVMARLRINANQSTVRHN